MGRKVVGTSHPRVDAVDKVTGRARYSVDVQVAGMHQGRVVRSQRAHALIRSIDTTAARGMPGVVAVITAEDLEGLFPRFGHIVADRPILALGRVRYYGEPVALVIARTSAEAADAAAAVRVDYDDLPAVITPEEALADAAPLLHDERYEHGDRAFAEAQSEHHGTNIAHEAELGWGDVEAGLADAAVVVESDVTFPMLYAYAMEPYNATAWFEDDRTLVVHTGAQHPFMVREDLARIFGLPLARVRVVSELIGGAYGSKSYTKVEPLAAVSAWATGRPVKLTLSVEESIYTTRADSATITVRSGFASDGQILARDFDIVLNTGAYADNGPLVLAKAVNRCFGPYRIPNLRVRGRAVYTNTSPSSSYRGFGAPQGALAGETNIDRAAERLGIDPAEMRRRNLVGRGEVLIPGKRPLDGDLAADLDMVVEQLDRGRRDEGGLRGTGFALTASDAGAFPASTALVRVQYDGSVVVLTGSTEMGQGSRTVITQLVSEELDVDPAQVHLVQGDTAASAYERTSGASRTTTLGGLSVQRACRDALGQLREMAAGLLTCPPDEVRQRDGGLVGPDGRSCSYAEAIEAWFGARAGEAVGRGAVRGPGDVEQLPPFWEIGAVGVELSVDPETGVVTVAQLVTVGDVGFALNPAAVEGQDLGAATQGLGIALYEELVYEDGQLENANVVDYRVPKTTDQPRRIATLLAQRGDGIGPFGAKGAGEGALNPVAAAAASAVARATGKWPIDLPLTPERVWRLLTDGERDGQAEQV